MSVASDTSVAPANDPADSLAVLESKRSTADTYGIPLAVLAELTHRCPLQCPYCSNPIELDRGGSELTTAEWKKVLSELAEIGVLQIHFSGGEPTARKDIVDLVQHASDVGLYSNLITSAVLLPRDKLKALADAGLCHVQISFQGNEPDVADRVAGLKNAHARKIEVAGWVRELDMPLTVNAVMHRQNLHQLADIIQMAVDLDADRLEVANVQYYGWALKNRAALMPTLEQIEETSRIVEQAQQRLKGILAIDYVVPDYYALRPKKCMGGWGRQFFNISPAGKVLPCHAAESIPGLDFMSVRSNRSIAWIWQNSEAFNRYRGTDWMPEPCRSCDYKEIDFGGCRCQAFALTGDAGNTDPACTLSPVHEQIFRIAETEAAEGSQRFLYRNFAGGTLETDSRDAPDAEAGKAANQRDLFTPLTSEHLDVGDGHHVYVESVGVAHGIPAVYLHGGPGSGCQPDHRKLFDPSRFHAVLFDQRGAGKSRPKASRKANTLPHLIADMEAIRTHFGFERWLLVGGSWGATLALAYAQALPHRVSGIVLRATFLGTRAELDAAFLETLPRFYPGLADDFLGLLAPEERAAPLDAYFRRILDSDTEIHTPAIRAWYQTERALSEHTPGRTRLDLAPGNHSRALPTTPTMEAHYFSNHCFMTTDQLLHGATKLAGIPGIIVQGRYDLLCPPATAHALIQRWPDADIRVVEGAGHALSDPGVRDAVVAAINDLAPRLVPSRETNPEAVC